MHRSVQPVARPVDVQHHRVSTTRRLAGLTGLLGVLMGVSGGAAAESQPDPQSSSKPPFRLPGVPGGSQEEPTGDSLVQMTLVPTADEKGRAMLAVVLRITQEWHIYWKNPGDSGLATDFEVTAPAGVRVGAIVYPRPTRLETADGVTFGHEGTAVFLVPLTRSDGAPVAGTISVTSRWLVCKSLCLSGSATAKVEIGPGVRSVPVAEPVGAKVAVAVARRPRPLSEWSGAAAEIQGRSLVVRGPASGAATVVFFPFDTPGVTPGTPRVSASGGSLRIEIPLDVEPANALGKPLQAGGLVGLGPAAAGRSYEILIPVPSG